MDDLFSLEGKNAVIVGGAGGIGSGLAEGFVRYGAQVAIADVNLTGLDNAVKGIEAATGQTVRSYPVDTGQESNVQELVAKTVADMGRVHVLVNAQGFNVRAPATEFPVEDWDRLFTVNVRGVMICCKNFAAPWSSRGRQIFRPSGVRAALGGNSPTAPAKAL
jgi:gluconate 5-dehydrogenase